MSVANLDSRKAEAAIAAFVARNKGDANAWLLQMGYAISGTTQWLNLQKSRGHFHMHPSVRPETDAVRLNVNWRTARPRTRRFMAKSLLVAKRRIWRDWTSQIGR